MAEEDSPDQRRAALAAALAAVPPDRPPSLTQELAAVLPQIEAALANGVSLESIRLALVSQGLTGATPGAFRGALYRARQRARQGQAPPGAPAPGPTKATAPAAKPTKQSQWTIPELERFQHNPSPDPDLLKGKK